MSKYSGTVLVDTPDRFTAPELMDPEAQKALKTALDELSFAAFTADREVMGRILPVVHREAVLRLTVSGAEARAKWVVAALNTGPSPTPAEIEKLAELRRVYEEMRAAFDATYRLIERGYARLG